jgi:hypothetical protein
MAFLIRFIFEEKLESTGYFTVGEGEVYIPAGTGALRNSYEQTAVRTPLW